MRRPASRDIIHQRQLQDYLSQAKQRDRSQPNGAVDVLYRDPEGVIHHRILVWRKAATSDALAEWMNDYLEMVRAGYQPKGYPAPPIPHCARIIQNGAVIAEWKLRPSFSAESHVTADEREGSGGIPIAPPSAPSSEYLAVPTQQAPRRKDSGLPEEDPPNDTRVGQASTVAQAGSPLER